MFLLFFLLFSGHLSKALSSKPQCPPSFECKNFGSSTYPFYNSSMRPECGFLKLDCSKKSPELQLQDGKILVIKNNITSSHSLLVSFKTFNERPKLQNCDVVNRFAFLKGSGQHIRIHRNQAKITMFKCSNTSSLFDHYRKIECGDHFLYYNETMQVPTIDFLPNSCVVLQLPYNQAKHNFTDLFSLLSDEFYISFHNRRCSSCHKIQEKNNRKVIIVAVLVGFALFMVLAIAIFFIRRTYKRKAFEYFSSKDKSHELEDVSVYFGVSVFSYAELQDATNHFDSSKELGDGGFGTVYYGKLRDGREVAVKRLYEHNYKRVQQFMNEVEILTRLRHQNLVSLYGCTSRKSRELLLVYEYIPNGTVADHLHGDMAKPSPLKWRTRMKIAIETANALVYLHASEIIHRDVKTTNILLDDSFCVKVADFGLSRLLPNDVTHVSTAPQGTPGYVDPEYHQCYQLTEKSDVYSFGVVLIELISSMPAIDISRSREEISLANMAINRIQRCALDELIDPFLATDPDTERMMTSVAELAFRCLQFDSESRPTMVEVLEVLKGIQVQESTVDDINELTTEKSKVPPPSPENEGAGLLKGLLAASPISVTAKWHSNSSESTAPYTSVIH